MRIALGIYPKAYAIIGNQVRILSSPAAVLTERCFNKAIGRNAREGGTVAVMSESEDLPRFNGDAISRIAMAVMIHRVWIGMVYRKACRARGFLVVVRFLIAIN